jgi:hypothetical protein
VNSVKLDRAGANCLGNLCHKVYLPIHVTLYGPSPSLVADNNGATLWINNANFGNSVAVSAIRGSIVNINGSYASNFTITASSAAQVNASNSSAQQTTVSVDSTSLVSVPTTNDLSATVPSNCSDFNNLPLLLLNGFSGAVKINGLTQNQSDLNQNICISDNNLIGNNTGYKQP